MIAPGPSGDEWDNIIQLALRTPDHGKLFPWRFVKIPTNHRNEFAKLLSTAFRNTNLGCRDTQAEAATAFIHMAPCLTVMIYSPKESVKIPEQEQILSAGAAGMNLIHAAHAFGYVASWITGWAAYDENVRSHLCDNNEKIIGFFFIGSPSILLEERARPDPQKHILDWQPSSEK